MRSGHCPLPQDSLGDDYVGDGHRGSPANKAYETKKKKRKLVGKQTSSPAQPPKQAMKKSITIDE